MKHTKPALFSLAIVVLLVGALDAQKRPLTHADYDGWRHIQNQHLSNDGKFLAYALFPQEGDGEVVVRNLQTGKEYRELVGQLPPPPPPNFAATEEEPPPPRGITMEFTRDGRTLVFSTFPSKAEVDQAKQSKKKPEAGPKNGLRIMDLATGSVVRVERVKSFQAPSKGNGVIAYLREPEAVEPEKSAKKKEYGSDLVLGDLGAGSDRVFKDVLEFSLAKDGKTLAYAVSSKNEDSNGVYELTIGTAGEPKALVNGHGKFSKLAWDEKQTELGFYGGVDTKLYVWQRDGDKAAELVSTGTPGFPAGSIVSDKSNVSFSNDGQHVFFGYAPKAPLAKENAIPVEDRVSVDLWSWRDDYIQPMQKVRARVDRNRSYRAVYNLADKKLEVLGDPSLEEITPSEDGRYSLGSDNRAYREMVEYDEHYADTYLVDNLTGSRKLVSKKHLGRVSWSSDGKYALFFDGKDWITLSAPDGNTTNLTANLGVHFSNEEHDTPGSAPPYGQAGWTKDGRFVLLYDHYDIWQVSPDGSSAKNLTKGVGRRGHLMFRYVKLSSDPDDKWIDPSQPLLLRAEDTRNHDSGFYRTRFNAGPPEKLIMAARNFTGPTKAKDADVLMLTASTFREFPDLQVTDSSFRELRKVSDANPQQSGILWGTAELVDFQNTDGVPLKATLYKPDNFDPKKKYPMLVYIYERLTQNVRQLCRTAAHQRNQRALLCQQWLPSAGAGHCI